MSEVAAEYEAEMDEPVAERDYEAEAREMGWHPLEEYRGDPGKWVDAKTFVLRGEQQMPIMRENNRKLMGRVRRTDDENADLRAQMAEMKDSLSTLRKMAERADEAGYQRALSEAKALQREAVRNGDEIAFDGAQAQIDQIEARREEVRSELPPKAEPVPAKAPQGTPEFRAWFAENKVWVQGDQTLGNAAIGFERELRAADNPDMTEADIWEAVTDMVQQKYPRRFAAATGSTAPAPAPVSEGSPRRAASVLAPSGGAPQSSRKASGIDSIQDPEERKAARAAFLSIRKSIPDYSEAEYMGIYVNPKADSITSAMQRKAKANGATH
jgi:hypothetical protein